MADVVLVLSIDVEEEGLFRGGYERRRPSVRNVAQLVRLSALLDECRECGLDLPVNLLCTHSVFADEDACRTLEIFRARHRVEIGAHLHHWNTPPSGENPDDGSYISPGRVPDSLLAARLESLLQAGRVFCGTALSSFRMGKWDLHRRHWPLLAEAGVLTDASVRPLHYSPAGPDHFCAPSDPYVVRVNEREILEVPLTCVPLFPRMRESGFFSPPLREKEGGGCAPAGLFAGHARAASVQKWGALAVLPAYHPLWAMEAITRVHLARGGRVISLTWHSSEMMPGGAPHVPDEASVTAFLDKVRRYLRRLAAKHVVLGQTFTELRSDAARLRLPTAGANICAGDWGYDAASC